VSGWAQKVVQATSALPHSSTHGAGEATQDPATHGRQAPLGSHTSPPGHGQVSAPQLSLQLVVAGQDRMQVSVCIVPPHPQSARATAKACTRPSNDPLFALTTPLDYLDRALDLVGQNMSRAAVYGRITESPLPCHLAGAATPIEFGPVGRRRGRR
jgi:hypothetical protein